MHSLLEAYLSEVAAHLSPLPPERREDELREMRAHLENAVIVNRELGQSEDEAALSAIAQFGTPRDLGESVVRAWRRGELLGKRYLWGAAACTLAVQFLLPLSLVPLENAYFNPISRSHVPTAQAAFLAFNFACNLGVPVLAGATSGVLFPKYAVAGTGLGRAAYFCLALALGGYWFTHHGPVPYPVSLSAIILSLTGQSVTGGIVSLLSAWLGSRARLAWRGRARLVRG